MASSPSARRRQRSTRLTVAAILLVSASALVGGALVTESQLLTSIAAVLAVVCGVVATRVTHSELMQSRREAARDRAAQAQEFATLTDQRVVASTQFAEGVTARLNRNQAALSQIETALCAAQRRAAEATRRLKVEERRAEVAEQEGQVYARKLDDAELRAAEAIVRVAELEQERDVMRAELDAWEAIGAGSYRKHA